MQERTSKFPTGAKPPRADWPVSVRYRTTALVLVQVSNARCEGTCGLAVSLNDALCSKERQRQRERGGGTVNLL